MRIILCFICMLISLSYFGQNGYHGIIINKDKQPISGVEIISIENPSNGSVSNHNGKFAIILNTDTQVNIFCLGYKPTQTVLNSGINIITLIENSQVLSEVFISSNKEVQTRQEIPSAISTIRSSMIKF